MIRMHLLFSYTFFFCMLNFSTSFNSCDKSRVKVSLILEHFSLKILSTFHFSPLQRLFVEWKGEKLNFRILSKSLRQFDVILNEENFIPRIKNFYFKKLFLLFNNIYQFLMFKLMDFFFEKKKRNLNEFLWKKKKITKKTFNKKLPLAFQMRFPLCLSTLSCWLI